MSMENAENLENGTDAAAQPEAANAAPEKSPLELAQEKLAESEKKYLYLYSEFENFRRRNEKERLDFIKFGHEGFLRDLLQVADNFERAVQHAKSTNPEKGTALANIAIGVEMIMFQFNEALKAQGVVAIQTTAGTKFDPALHEAVSDEESDLEPGTIVSELTKGFMLHGRLLRAARVVTAKKKA